LCQIDAILSADVVGYPPLMANDEPATAETVTARRETVRIRVRNKKRNVGGVLAAA
jgi:hypothetical protein